MLRYLIKDVTLTKREQVIEVRIRWQTEALTDLYAAKKEIESRIDELKNMLGMATDPNQALADAASMIEQAQKDVSEAMSGMQQSPDSGTKQAGQLLDHANGLVGPLAAGKLGALPSSAQAALQSAAQRHEATR